MISIIAAMDRKRVIGWNNSLPWHLPNDLNHFYRKVANKPVIMGLNTFRSMRERPLPESRTIVLSRDYIAPDGVCWAQSIDEALDMVKGWTEVMVCGGANVYRQFLPRADLLYLTLIHGFFKGDAYFPKFDAKDWRQLRRKNYCSDRYHSHPYSFLLWKRSRRNR